jgi:hypothetical protein
MHSWTANWEEALFQKLSSDPSLRAEMQDHLAIRKAVQNDIEAYTPPASATAAIFTTLGFTIPSSSVTAAAAAAAATAAAGSGSMLRSMWFSAASSALAVATAVLLYLQFPVAFDAIGTVVERVVSSPSDIVVVEETAPLTDLIVTTQRRSAPAPATSAVTTAPVVQEREVTLRDMQLLAAALSEQEAPGRVRGEQVYFYDLLPTPDGVTFHARNVALRSDPAPSVVSQSEPWFRNVNLGLMYALDDHHAVGIEAGRESFSQHFNGLENGMGVRYEQNPLAYWATAVYQFTGEPLLPHVHPFIQIQAGGAFEIGGLGRATLGIKFRPFDRIAVIAGAEGSLMVYRFQSNWFSTNKVGMTYGLSYEF